MTGHITWKKDYDTGVEEIDSQHQYFSMLINRLMEELVKSKDDSYKSRLLEELARYASFHFLSEENIMMNSNYPGLEEHKKLHRELINSLNDKINYLSISKMPHEELVSFLIEWFISHTLVVDKKFGLFVERER